MILGDKVRTIVRIVGDTNALKSDNQLFLKPSTALLFLIRHRRKVLESFQSGGIQWITTIQDQYL